jgi:FtsP/CotA-like multicopper oxidase with cupredoxin domain
MHLHGHNMYILHEGPGFYGGQPFVNPSNPQRRDVQMLRPNGHIVVQYDADNPGVWPFHCHIAWHLSLVSKTPLYIIICSAGYNPNVTNGS